MCPHPPVTPITSFIHQFTHRSLHPSTHQFICSFIYPPAFLHLVTDLPTLPFTPTYASLSFTHHSPVHPQSISDPPTHPPYIYLPPYTPPHPPTCPSIDPCIHLHINPSTHPIFPTHPFSHLFIHQSAHPHTLIHSSTLSASPKLCSFCSVISSSQPQNLPLNK